MGRLKCMQISATTVNLPCWKAQHNHRGLLWMLIFKWHSGVPLCFWLFVLNNAVGRSGINKYGLIFRCCQVMTAIKRSENSEITSHRPSRGLRFILRRESRNRSRESNSGSLLLLRQSHPGYMTKSVNLSQKIKKRKEKKKRCDYCFVFFFMSINMSENSVNRYISESTIRPTVFLHSSFSLQQTSKP